MAKLGWSISTTYKGTADWRNQTSTTSNLEWHPFVANENCKKNACVRVTPTKWHSIWHIYICIYIYTLVISGILSDLAFYRGSVWCPQWRPAGIRKVVRCELGGVSEIVNELHFWQNLEILTWHVGNYLEKFEIVGRSRHDGKYIYICIHMFFAWI